MILGGGALKCTDGFRGGGMVVVGDEFDLASVDPARGVYLVGGKLSSLGNRSAGDRLRLGNDADLDRLI
jgi:hypothetical protein